MRMEHYFTAEIFVFLAFITRMSPARLGNCLQGDSISIIPLLLLQTTRVASWIRRPPLTLQPVVETGRMVSAIFAAGGVACFINSPAGHSFVLFAIRKSSRLKEDQYGFLQ
jgi:hypothetical protein